MATCDVFYLKYRPQTLEQLIGQDLVKKTLLNSFQNRLSHAYLFVGPRGTGKTSTARILAKMVNCEGKGESGKGEVPCNECTTCLSITDGSNMDLIEIDAASNRGIEDIRSLRDKIKLAPSSVKKKVYIIDEVHMLTTEAFNALLKTLEEPPKHALFILATTEASKVPQTILSRVQRLDFKLAKPSEIEQALQKIIEKEKIDIESGALKMLVKSADGSFRDGVKLLDQISSSGSKITAEFLEEVLKFGRFDEVLEVIKNLQQKNTRKALGAVLKQIEYGTDVKELILSLMEYLRKLVLIKNGLGEELIKPQFTEDKYEELVKLAESFTISDLVRDLDILQDSLEKLRFASILSLPLELAVVEMCEKEATGNRSSTPRSLRLEEQQATDKKNVIASPEGAWQSSDSINNPTLEDSSLIPMNEIHRGSTMENTIGITRNDKKGTLDGQTSNIQHPTSNTDIQKLKEKWTFVLETVRSVNFSLEALLRSINITECAEKTVNMEVPYSFHQRILESPKNRELLEGILSDILGRNIRILVKLGARPKRLADIQNIEIAQDDEVIKAAAEIFSLESSQALDS